MKSQRFVKSHEPHFAVTYNRNKNNVAAAAPVVMHPGMKSEHAFENGSPQIEHMQRCETMAAVHSTSVEQFIAKQRAQSERWLTEYANEINTKAALSSRFVFGRVTPLLDAHERDDTVAAILRDYGK